MAALDAAADTADVMESSGGYAVWGALDLLIDTAAAQSPAPLRAATATHGHGDAVHTTAAAAAASAATADVRRRSTVPRVYGTAAVMYNNDAVRHQAAGSAIATHSGSFSSSAVTGGGAVQAAMQGARGYNYSNVATMQTTRRAVNARCGTNTVTSSSASTVRRAAGGMTARHAELWNLVNTALDPALLGIEAAQAQQLAAAASTASAAASVQGTGSIAIGAAAGADTGEVDRVVPPAVSMSALQLLSNTASSEQSGRDERRAATDNGDTGTAHASTAAAAAAATAATTAGTAVAATATTANVTNSSVVPNDDDAEQQTTATSGAASTGNVTRDSVERPALSN
jgi:trimeric autotransporter adhesin